MGRESRAFAGKVAVITGGASGIGKALGEHLAGLGAVVTLADVREEPCRAAADDIEARGGRASAVAVDVTESEAVQGLVDATVREHGRLDYMFNNAGIIFVGEARDTPLEQWNRLVDVNLRGVVHGVAAAYPRMIDQGFGHIVNTASLAGVVPSPGVVAYSATKHAVVGLSISLRAEAARYGVRVSAVCPGFIRLMDSTTMPDRPERAVDPKGPVDWYTAEACARDIAEGVARDRAVIVVARHAKLASALYRWLPDAAHRLVTWGFARRQGG